MSLPLPLVERRAGSDGLGYTAAATGMGVTSERSTDSSESSRSPRQATWYCCKPPAALVAGDGHGVQAANAIVVFIYRSRQHGCCPRIPVSGIFASLSSQFEILLQAVEANSMVRQILSIRYGDWTKLAKCHYLSKYTCECIYLSKVIFGTEHCSHAQQKRGNPFSRMPCTHSSLRLEENQRLIRAF